jgi:hypothetical protein
MSPWSARVGDGETTCSTIMSVFSTLALATYLTWVNHFGKYPLTNRSAIGENISVI